MSCRDAATGRSTAMSIHLRTGETTMKFCNLQAKQRSSRSSTETADRKHGHFHAKQAFLLKRFVAAAAEEV